MTAPNPSRSPSHRLLPIVAVSLTVGFVLPVLLALGPASGGGESRMAGAALLGWGIGWGLIASLSIRLTPQGQRWARVPAAIFGVTGSALIALAPGAPVMDLLAWVWPVPLLVLAAWLALRVRRGVTGRSRWLLYPVLGVLALLAVGGALEAVVEATDDSRSTAGGELVDVGGHRLFVACTGAGSPTVVLESGLGEGATYWARIAPEVASTTRVCSYDRAGRGRSEPAGAPRDGAAIARDLHALLAAAGIPGPYVLAGHSSGGVYVRVFAAAYPAEVAGVVLLDAQSPGGATVLARSAGAQRSIGTLAGLFPLLARVGLVRLVLPAESVDLPLEAAARQHAEQVSARGAASFGEEFVHLGGILAAAGDLPNLGDLPLVVVTAASQPPAGWLAQQDRLARLSTHLSHRVFADLTHASLIESTKGAAASSAAIVDVVSSVRSGTRLDARDDAAR